MVKGLNGFVSALLGCGLGAAGMALSRAEQNPVAAAEKSSGVVVYPIGAKACLAIGHYMDFIQHGGRVIDIDYDQSCVTIVADDKAIDCLDQVILCTRSSNNPQVQVLKRQPTYSNETIK